MKKFARKQIIVFSLCYEEHYKAYKNYTFLMSVIV